MKSIVDIGGSNIKFYTEQEGSNLVLINSLRTPKDPDLLLGIIVDHINHSDHDEFYVGLPGPVYGGESKIFLPPLDYFFDASRLRSLISEKYLVIGNDCAILHKIMDDNMTELIYENRVSNSPFQGSICMTIGTSFGISGMTSSAGQVSLEMAHIPIKCILGLAQLYTRDYRQLDLDANVRNMLNSKSLLAIYEETTSQQDQCPDTCSHVDLIRELIIGSSILAAKLMGISSYKIYIISGIHEILLNMIRSELFHDKLMSKHSYIHSIRTYAQNHIEHNSFMRQTC